MNNKKVTNSIFLFLIIFQFLFGLTYFNFNTGERNNVNTLDPEISDVIVGNYTFPGTNGPVYLNESIKIGLLGDLEDLYGDHSWNGALLAAKEINEAGGITINGSQHYVGLVAEDTDEQDEIVNVSKGVDAANKIISYDPHAIIGGSQNESVSAYIEPIMDANIPFLSTCVSADELCQKVNNSYSKYKYFFRVLPINSSRIGNEIFAHFLYRLAELNATHDGWIKNVAILRENETWSETLSEFLQTALPVYLLGFGISLNPVIEYNISTEITYSEMTTIWEQVNASGAQVVISLFSSNASIIVSQTYADVQPMCLLEGLDVKSTIDDFWDDTEGGCQYESVYQTLYNTSKTSKTIPFFNNYIEEYNIEPFYTGVGAYEAVYMLTNVSLTSQSLKSDDIVTGLEGFNKTNPFIGVSAKKAFWNSTHDLVQGYPYGYGIWCQWQLDGTKVVISSPYNNYPDSLTTGNLTLPYWGVHNLTEPQDIPGNFTLSSTADSPDNDGTFYLYWSPSDGAKNYSVYMYNRSISYISKRYLLNSYEGLTDSCLISGLNTGEYYFIAVAYNNTGERLSNIAYVEVDNLNRSNVIVGNYTFPGVAGPPLLNESIKIGLLGDLETIWGDHSWNGALLAAKEINEAGGILINSTQYFIGLVAEDTDEQEEIVNVSKGVDAANKIISYDPHSIIGGTRNESLTGYLEPIMNAKIPFLGTGLATDEFCQMVSNNYAKYKYFFRVMPTNSSVIGLDVIQHLANRSVILNATYNGWFKKVAILREDLNWTVGMSEALKLYLPTYFNLYSGGTLFLDPVVEYNISTSITYSEMTTIWNEINTSGIQLVIPIFSSNASTIVSKTYADVQPMCFMEGIDVRPQLNDFWDDTEGGCQYEVVFQSTYNVSKTSKTIPFWNCYIEEYNIEPLYTGIGAYEAVYMLANVSFTSQSLKPDDIVTGLEGFNTTNPFIGVAGRKAFWNNTHDLVAGYYYAFGLWCQWQLDGTKVVLPSTHGVYDPLLATGSLALPYWGINNLVAAQDIPGAFTLSSDADTPVDNDGTFSLYWSPSDGAKNYSVYMYDRNISYISKRYALDSYEGLTASCPISGLNTGEYYFIAAAYNNTGERLSNIVYVEVDLGPKNFTLTTDAEVPVDTDGNFNLIWTPSVGADNYSLYTFNSSINEINSSLTNLAYQNATSPYWISGLMDGSYFFVVVAHNNTGDRLSNCIYIKVLHLPGQFTLSSDAELPDTDGNFNLTWTASTGATNYSIFRSSDYITVIDSSPTLIGTVQATNSSFEITGLGLGFYFYIVRAYNGYNYTLSNCIEVNVQFYDEKTGFWELPPLVIDDTGDGNYNWSEAVTLPWCSGSGTASDPFIIELITIDGNVISTCLVIRNSNVSFIIRNSSFINGGDGLGVSYVSNGKLIYLNCSHNGGNGIFLDSCQNINITSCSANYNELNGILLLNCNNIRITYNDHTINNNDQNGISLEGSDYNTIIGNTISYNHIYGIYLDQYSDNNYIDWNTFQGNNQPIFEEEGALNNIIGENNIFISEDGEFPIDMLIILLIITAAIFGGIAAAIIIKKRVSLSEKKEKEISEKKKEKIRIKLVEKLRFVDHLINERKIQLAYKNLGKIKDKADQYDFFAIFNQANAKVEICKDIEAGLFYEVTREEPSAPVVSREESTVPVAAERVREEEAVPVVARTKEKETNVFLSYSTLDVDRFQIERIVKHLEEFSEINRVYYYSKDSGQNIVEYMENTLRVCNIFVLFCTKQSKRSKAVEGEWQAAYQLVKKGVMKIIPVYEDEDDVPILLIPLLNVRYDKDNFNGFVNKLRQEILR